MLRAEMIKLRHFVGQYCRPLHTLYFYYRFIGFKSHVIYDGKEQGIQGTRRDVTNNLS